MRFQLQTTGSLLKKSMLVHTLPHLNKHTNIHTCKHTHTQTQEFLGLFSVMLTFSLTFKAKFGCLDIVLPLQEFNNKKHNSSYKHTLTYADTIIHTRTHTQKGRVQTSGCFIFLCFGCLTLAMLRFSGQMCPFL